MVFDVWNVVYMQMYSVRQNTEWVAFKLGTHWYNLINVLDIIQNDDWENVTRWDVFMLVIYLSD